MITTKGCTQQQKLIVFKDTHREKATSSKTPVLTKTMIMVIWEVGISNQLIISGS